MTFDAWPYGAKPVAVLSRTMSTLKVPDGGVCELMSGNPDEIGTQLTQAGMKHLYIDGEVTIRGSLNAGLIQRLTITRIPVLRGSGLPLFSSLPGDTRSCQSGMVQSEYVIAR
jgi:dihydrofolate reductase